MGVIINDENTCSCGAYWQTNGYCTAGHPQVRKEQFEFTVIPNVEDPEMGGYFAYRTGYPHWVRGFGDTPLDAIVCLCVCWGEQNEETWMYERTSGYIPVPKSYQPEVKVTYLERDDYSSSVNQEPAVVDPEDPENS